MEQLQEVIQALAAGEISQLGLAAEAGVTQPAISDIVNGRTRSPRIKTVQALHDALIRVRAARAHSAGVTVPGLSGEVPR